MSFADEIIHKRYDNVVRFIDSVPVNDTDEYGYTPLIEAAIADSTEIAALLLEHGADVNGTDVTGGTALHWAVENNNMELCKWFSFPRE